MCCKREQDDLQSVGAFEMGGFLCLAAIAAVLRSFWIGLLDNDTQEDEEIGG